MNSANKLLYGHVQGERVQYDLPVEYDWAQVRDSDVYKRDDKVSYTYGPEDFLVSPVFRTHRIWKAEAVGDKVVLYRDKTRQGQFELRQVLFSHTAQIDNLSLVFDQNGRPQVVFESQGNVYLRWFDPIPGQTVTTEIGKGRTPKITFNTYYNLGSVSSELSFVFVNDNDKVELRRQLNRYSTPQVVEDTSEVKEIVEYGVSVEGKLCCVYVYGQDEIGSVSSEGVWSGFYPGDNLTFTDQTNMSASVLTGNIRDILIELSAEEESTDQTNIFGSVISGSIKEVLLEEIFEGPSTNQTSISGSVVSGNIKETLVEETFEGPSTDQTSISGAVLFGNIYESLVSYETLQPTETDQTNISGTITLAVIVEE